MKVYEHWSSGFWVLIGAAITVASVLLGIGTIGKPGAGFASFLAGVVIVILAGFDLVSAYRARQRNAVDLPQREAVRKMVVAIGALVAYSLLMPTLGFPLTTLALMFVLFRHTEAMPWKSSLFTAFCVTAAAYLLFSQLGTELPKGIFFEGGLPWM
jgi:hypothetical protein